MKIKVGSWYIWKNSALNFGRFQITKLKDNLVYYSYYDLDSKSCCSEEDFFRWATEYSEENVVDNIVAPSHYNSTSITALKVINDWSLDFYLGNTIKYIARNEKKGSQIQDLEKAVQYLQLKIQLLKDGNTKQIPTGE